MNSDANAGPEFRAFSAVTYAGGYQLGGVYGLRVNLCRKPSWWHRFWMRACLGWEWVDNP